MTDPSFTSEADRDLLVVLPSREEAEAAAQMLLRAGIAPDDVRVDAEPDRIASLRAEMHEELSEAFVVPNAAVAYTKESARGLVLGNVLGIALGMAAAVPLALIPIGDTSYLLRLLIFALVGAAFGGTVGLVAGPAITSIRPDMPPAIERGTLLRVRHDSAELRRLLSELHPIRMDEIRREDDLPIGTVVTEDSGNLEQTAVDAVENVQQGDDYTPPDGDRRTH